MMVRSKAKFVSNAEVASISRAVNGAAAFYLTDAGGEPLSSDSVRTALAEELAG
jgi:hypothetical protein